MKITEILQDAQKTLFSFEILPPLKGESIQTLFNDIEPLMEFKPAFIDVTYHREEYVYKDRGNGLLEKIATRKRPGTVGMCAAIMNRYGVEAVPHLICGGFTKEETENALIDLNFLGIESILALRGDPIKSEPSFTPDPKGHKYSTELIQQIIAMNQGKYMDESLENSDPTNFCVGVAGYPEKHYESPNLVEDIKYLKKKIDAGAGYIVTQMFFDNQKYFDFVKICREEGINVPIIPGLKPLTVLSQLTALPRFFHIDIPEDLVKAVSNAKSKDEIKQIGINWCIQQSKELINFGVPCLHYYSMSKSVAVKEIAKAVF
ncbi:MAG: methylenetetrahydrofolate reductase [NAD(P)H] [Bacteroidetes bacterium]|nr:MAG: methylenetetrahydrofolate reductase [NAD(P)H] [Bacteroidota bacterium]